MKYHVVAIDYDGTLATQGVVDSGTVDRLHLLRRSGRRLVLVTGRLLPSLLHAFPLANVFDRVVAENGAVLYSPDTRVQRLLADAPSHEFHHRLRKNGIPIDEVGDVVTVTHVPYETAVLATIRELGLEYQIIFNKGAVMVLPTGVNKASGLQAALVELGLSPRSAVGIGDAENDEAFLKLCEASFAVDNAIDAIKSIVDVTLTGTAGAGVVELSEKLLGDDLVALHQGGRREFTLGVDRVGNPIGVPVYGTRMLLTGDSASGKSALAVSIVHQLIDAQYQTCIVDPEGDFQAIDDLMILGTRDHPPEAEEVLHLLKSVDKSFVLSLFGARSQDQPLAFCKIFRVLQDHRIQTGRPHWHVVDEAHYPISAAWAPIEELNLRDWRSVMYVTAFPQRMPTTVVERIQLFVAMGANSPERLVDFCALVGERCPRIPPPPDLDWSGLAWWRNNRKPTWFRTLPLRGEHQRHQHEYYDGDMAPADRFYFRGPDNALNLPAANLRAFAEIAHGVDDGTWMYHLSRGDYERWFREKIQDHTLADLADRVRHEAEQSPDRSREEISKAIHQLYARESETTR